MQKNIKICLLLTGTIKPGIVPNLKLVNYKEREKQYIEAITKWKKLNLPIIFCDNSNYTSDVINYLFRTSPNNHEYLKYLSKNSIHGKGSGEAELLDYVFKNSTLIHESDYICKVTGRYYIKNFRKILKFVNSDKNNISIYSNISKYLTWVDSRFFIFKKEFYNNYLNARLLEINESKGIYFEHVLAQSVHDCMSNRCGWRLLPVYPDYIGLQGTSGISDKSNLFQKIKYNIYFKLKNYILTRSI